MSKGVAKKTKGKNMELSNKTSENDNNNYLLCMREAPRLGESTHWFQMIPAAFFTAAIITITHMASYERPMVQFFWSGGENQLVDFFSYYKMVGILICAIIALVILAYRIFAQNFFIKRSFAYIPIVLYSGFVLLSYLFSEYKLFALWGWNERFEGTLVLLCYMVMLFYIINSVNSVRDVKWIVYSVAVVSFLLSVLGISQALGHDFFQSNIGKKFITPNWFWNQLDNLSFTFKNNEIYQTVYNINYVSFYLTLLIPLFGMIFIYSLMKGKEEATWKKIFWGVLFALLVFNLIGSASSGGLLGTGFAVLAGIIVLNKKLLQWKKPILFLVVITIIIAGATYNRWIPELMGAVGGVLGVNNTAPDNKQSKPNVATNEAVDIRGKIDYLITKDQDIILSYAGEELTFTTYADDPTALKIVDSDGDILSIEPTNMNPIYRIADKRFKRITIRTAQDEQANNYMIIGTDGNEWAFLLSKDGVKYRTALGTLISLHKIPAIGWEDNQAFGSGRGYIWSRTIPMMKDTLVLGHGADTYCIYFPHEDYAGKYNSGTFSNNINVVVDKPHNMYFGAIIGTGALSLLALLVLWGIYIVQSFKLYRRTLFDDFMPHVGSGIFFGICGFLVAGLVNDSSVSVMPMFYGLLGVGISINTILKNTQQI